MRRRLVSRLASFAAALVLGVALDASPARAFQDDPFGTVRGILDASCEGTDSPEYEARLIKAVWDNWWAKVTGPKKGQCLVNGEDILTHMPEGVTVTLQYRYADIVTGFPVTGPAISYVEYLVELDHGGPLVLLPAGTSSNPTDLFAVSYTVTGCEPLIVAIPRDAGGAEIILPGHATENPGRGYTAILEPRSMPMGNPGLVAMMAGALLAIGAAVLRRRRLA